MHKNRRLAFDGETGWALKKAASLAFFAVGVPKKNHLHSATAAHRRFIHQSPLSRGSRSGTLDRHLARFRQAQVAGRTIEDMEVREAALRPIARVRIIGVAVRKERGNHGTPFQVVTAGSGPARRWFSCNCRQV